MSEPETKPTKLYQINGNYIAIRDGQGVAVFRLRHRRVDAALGVPFQETIQVPTVMEIRDERTSDWLNASEWRKARALLSISVAPTIDTRDTAKLTRSAVALFGVKL